MVNSRWCEVLPVMNACTRDPACNDNAMVDLQSARQPATVDVMLDSFATLQLFVVCRRQLAASPCSTIKSGSSAARFIEHQPHLAEQLKCDRQGIQATSGRYVPFKVSS